MSSTLTVKPFERVANAKVPDAAARSIAIFLSRGRRYLSGKMKR